MARIRNDERPCLLVERGQRWVELAAVELPVTATILEPGAEAERAAALLTARYDAFRLASSRMSEVTVKHYAGQAVIRLDPAGRVLSWDNAKLRLNR